MMPAAMTGRRNIVGYEQRSQRCNCDADANGSIRQAWTNEMADHISQYADYHEGWPASKDWNNHQHREQSDHLLDAG